MAEHLATTLVQLNAVNHYGNIGATNIHSSFLSFHVTSVPPPKVRQLLIPTLIACFTYAIVEALADLCSFEYIRVFACHLILYDLWLYACIDDWIIRPEIRLCPNCRVKCLYTVEILSHECMRTLVTTHVLALHQMTTNFTGWLGPMMPCLPTEIRSVVSAEITPVESMRSFESADLITPQRVHEQLSAILRETRVFDEASSPLRQMLTYEVGMDFCSYMKSVVMFLRNPRIAHQKIPLHGLPTAIIARDEPSLDQYGLRPVLVLKRPEKCNCWDCAYPTTRRPWYIPSCIRDAQRDTTLLHCSESQSLSC